MEPQEFEAWADGLVDMLKPIVEKAYECEDSRVLYIAGMLATICGVTVAEKSGIEGTAEALAEVVRPFVITQLHKLGMTDEEIVRRARELDEEHSPAHMPTKGGVH